MYIMIAISSCHAAPTPSRLHHTEPIYSPIPWGIGRSPHGIYPAVPELTFAIDWLNQDPDLGRRARSQQRLMAAGFKSELYHPAHETGCILPLSPPVSQLSGRPGLTPSWWCKPLSNGSSTLNTQTRLDLPRRWRQVSASEAPHRPRYRPFHRVYAALHMVIARFTRLTDGSCDYTHTV
jgi:hypothetical protein